MKISSFITITNPHRRGDTYDQCLESARGFSDEVITVDGGDTWPYEFEWPIIGQHFQKGYNQAVGDWVIHLDCDYIFHERDYGRIIRALRDHDNEPAVSFYKWQFILPDRYNLKSRLVLAVNKKRFGSRIKFDSGGDLCQPSLDGVKLSLDEVPQSGVPMYNYERILKTREQLTEDAGRMDRAYFRHLGSYQFDSDGDDIKAYEGWLRMAKGRFSKPQQFIKLSEHPKVMQGTIRNLTPENWGYSGHGNLEVNRYA